MARMVSQLQRRITQLCGLLLGHGYLAVMATRATYQGPLRGACLPMLTCYACPTAFTSCPIGTLQHFMSIGAVPWLLLGGLVMVGVLGGRVTCGWLCPFGLVQDLLHRLSGWRLPLPPWARYGKYLVLVVLVIGLPLATKVPWFSQVCPMGTLSAGLPWMLWSPESPQGVPLLPAPGLLWAVKIGILVAFLLLFVVVKRPFCRAVCPLGAIFSLFTRHSLVQLEVSRRCRRCNRCIQWCPVDHHVWRDPNSPECIRCLACTRCAHVRVRALPRPHLADGALAAAAGHGRDDQHLE